MNPKLYTHYKDYNKNIVTFLLFNLSGQVVGYQHYRPDVLDKGIKNNPKLGRYYTHLPRNTQGVFGLERLDPAKRTLYVTEGIFKAATLHRLGYNAVATLTATPEQLRGWFLALGGAYRVYGIGDADKAGKELVNIVGNGLQSPQDLDEMSDGAIRDLLYDLETSALSLLPGSQLSFSFLTGAACSQKEQWRA